MLKAVLLLAAVTVASAVPAPKVAPSKLCTIPDDVTMICHVDWAATHGIALCIDRDQNEYTLILPQGKS